MSLLVKKYISEIIVFTTCTVLYWMATQPTITWYGLGADGPDFAQAAEFWRISHPTFQPVITMIMALVSHIFWWEDSFRVLNLLSAMTSVVTSFLIYLCVRHYSNNRTSSMIAAITFLSGSLVMSQSVITEMYALAVFLCVLAFYFIKVKQNYLLGAISLALLVGGHHIGFAVGLILVATTKPMWNVKYFLIACTGFLSYLYVYFAARPPYEWTSGFINGLGFASGSSGTYHLLGIAVMSLPARLQEFGTIIITSLGVGLVSLWTVFKKEYRLLWVLSLFPLVYYITSIPPQVVTYTMFGIAFSCILVGIGLSKLNHKQVTYVATIVSVSMLMVNTLTINKPKDAEQFLGRLKQLPNDSIIITTRGWPWLTIYYYQVANNNRITGVNIPSMLTEEWYLTELQSRGINVPDWETIQRVKKQLTTDKPNSYVRPLEEWGVAYITNNNLNNKEIYFATLTSSKTPHFDLVHFANPIDYDPKTAINRHIKRR